MAIDINKEIHNDFIIYAEAVNNDRAFPSALDGLKPVQRACLWEMYHKGYSSNKPHVKSAKIVGGVIGSWHPHGDSAAYGAMVGMSQPWVRNIPEVDFHGANGSLQGGPDAASARYTEARLSKASEIGFFDTIKKNTVDFIPNFSEDETWPQVLPAIFPRLFVNGSSGIGYTIANDWPLGNLGEYTEKVKQYLKNKKIDFKDIYPDYPTGGIIINKDAIEDIYKTGRGSLTIRATTEVKDRSIFITELPYQVYAEAVISKIKELVNAGTLEGIDDIFNKSGKEGLNIEIVCNKNVDPNIVLNKLFRLTDLQKAYTVNQMAIVDKTPILLNLQDYIKVYVDHNINCIQREFKFELDKAIARKEIIDGLLKALVDIDEIIACIKKSNDSDDAKNNLQKQFGFTENQAAAIVAMRLGRLAHLEAIELDKEDKELQKTIDECNSILSSEKKQQKILMDRLEAFTKEFGWDRRTKLDNIDIVVERKEVTKNVTKTKKEFMMILTHSNTIKRTLTTNYKHITSGIEKELMSAKVPTGGKVNLISNKGNHYKLAINKIKVGLSNSTGTSLKDLLGLPNDEIIIGLYSKEATVQPYLFFVTEMGYTKKVVTEGIMKIGKTGATPVMKLAEGDKMIFNKAVKDTDSIEVITNKGTYTIETKLIKEKGRAAGGARTIKLKKDEVIEEVK